VLARIDANLAVFTDAFPAPSSVGGVYPAMGNVEWTNGFWTGMLWLAYEVSGEARYRQAAERQVRSFKDRVDRRINVDHHDLGFLYSLSCVAAYKLTGDAHARDAALEAARLLLARYLPQAGIIQAWGDLSDPEQAGRMIIDCNLNLPLLYWASEMTGDRAFADAADSHIEQAARHIVRPDSSTFHTFFMDPVTGAPRMGKTHQGFSDSSCWARGQAWGISGFPLVHRYKADAVAAGAQRPPGQLLSQPPAGGPDLLLGPGVHRPAARARQLGGRDRRLRPAGTGPGPAPDRSRPRRLRGRRPGDRRGPGRPLPAAAWPAGHGRPGPRGLPHAQRRRGR
jgi:hypothetical protein